MARNPITHKRLVKEAPKINQMPLNYPKIVNYTTTLVIKIIVSTEKKLNNEDTFCLENFFRLFLSEKQIFM